MPFVVFKYKKKKILKVLSDSWVVSGISFKSVVKIKTGIKDLLFKVFVYDAL